MSRTDAIRAAICCLALMSMPPWVSAARSPAPSSDGHLARLSEELGSLFAAGEYHEALPVARRIVTLLEARHAGGMELAAAYENLGRIQLRAGDPAAAQASQTRVLELLAVTQGIASPKAITPLRELAAAYQAQGRTAGAVDALLQAMAISHRALGLFNVEQLQMIEPLIGLYERLGDEEGVDREIQHAVMVADHVYGADDLRLLPLIERLASRLEQNDRYAQARPQWERMVDIASREGGGRNAATINGLLGVARSHRLQYVRDPDSIVMKNCRRDPDTRQLEPLMVCTQLGQPIRLADAGETAALRALKILDSTPDPPPVLLAATLLELGDWYVVARDPEVAIQYYQRAWPLLDEQGTPARPNPLLVPRPLGYRRPAAAGQYAAQPGAVTATTPIEFSLTVKADGETADITPVSDPPEARLSRIRRALEKAAFSPRFEDGKPVVTKGYRFVEYWNEPASAASAGAAGNPPVGSSLTP
jgi:tetratricopeptide (TPR) repeat protein